ncbi:hypothetical protein [Actinomadura violacea]|uniref:Secreted protein n=1 Tax=Actinomadura violacea TaxID=2819934 RepID=A0ABS3RUR1_9ACTN|nr:hypothetical protein [Actinomadura violacea]MBO2460233.1 hypothetical protein [Actinomadura violacea]
MTVIVIVGVFMVAIAVAWWSVNRAGRVANPCSLVPTQDAQGLVPDFAKKGRLVDNDTAICSWTRGHEDLMVKVQRFSDKGNVGGEQRADRAVAEYRPSQAFVRTPPAKVGKVDEIWEWYYGNYWYMHIALRYDNVIVWINYVPVDSVKVCPSTCPELHEANFRRLAQGVMRRYRS